MPTPLAIAVNAIVTSHPFFTTWIGPAVTAVQKRALARKLMLYELRGRPWHSRDADIVRLDKESVLWDPRPQLGQARTRLEQTLTRFCAAPYVVGEPVLAAHRLFPAVYWGARYGSGTQWGYVRDIIRRYHGQPSPMTISAGDLARYNALRLRPDDGYANTDRARLIMKYNVPDVPPSLPGAGLVDTPLF